jgi:circadian clock protein KaiC
LLYSLIRRFKSLNVTSIFTLESPSMFSTGSITDRDFSPIADNLLMLRYSTTEDTLQPTLTVVKTRGTEHDRGTHLFEIGKGGMRIGERLGKRPVEQSETIDADAKSRRTERK